MIFLSERNVLGEYHPDVIYCSISFESEATELATHVSTRRR